MSGVKLTKLSVLGFIAIAIIYDIVIYASAGVDATISRVTLQWASDIPIIVLAPGILIGHLFWPQPIPAKPTSKLKE
jgi:hypothetical protein